MPDPAIDLGSALILGAVQGVTEFLPISSDGHLALGSMLLGVSSEMPLSMVVLLHFGTLVATTLIFAKDLRALVAQSWTGLRAGPRAYLETDAGRLVASIVVASFPTAIIGLGLEDHVEDLSRSSWVVGLGLLVSAGAAWSTRRGGGKQDYLTLTQALIVGVAQGIAVLPGVSRSGCTIATAMLLGMSGPAAFRFSFLLSLPAITGATLLSARHTEELAALGLPAVAGAVVSLVVGLGALLVLRRLVDRGRFWVFAVYLVPLGSGLCAWRLVTLVTEGT